MAPEPLHRLHCKTSRESLPFSIPLYSIYALTEAPQLSSLHCCRWCNSFPCRLNLTRDFSTISLFTLTPQSMVHCLHDTCRSLYCYVILWCVGTFLYDSPMERRKNKLDDKTQSLWSVSFLHHMTVSPLYHLSTHLDVYFLTTVLYLLSKHCSLHAPTLAGDTYPSPTYTLPSWTPFMTSTLPYCFYPSPLSLWPYGGDCTLTPV